MLDTKYALVKYIVTLFTLVVVGICCLVAHGATDAQPVVIMFTAEYCGPCHYALRVIDEEQAQNKLTGIELRILDIQKNAAMAQQWAITATPTFLVGTRNQGIVLRTHDVREALEKAKQLR